MDPGRNCDDEALLVIKVSILRQTGRKMKQFYVSGQPGVICECFQNIGTICIELEIEKYIYTIHVLLIGLLGPLLGCMGPFQPYEA